MVSQCVEHSILTPSAGETIRQRLDIPATGEEALGEIRELLVRQVSGVDQNSKDDASEDDDETDEQDEDPSGEPLSAAEQSKASPSTPEIRRRPAGEF